MPISGGPTSTAPKTPSKEDIRLLLVQFLRRSLDNPSQLQDILEEAALRGFLPKDFPEVEGLQQALQVQEPQEDLPSLPKDQR